MTGMSMAEARALLARRITYHVPSLDPITGRTVDQIIGSYDTDNEARIQAGWQLVIPGDPVANAVASHLPDAHGAASHVHLPILDLDGPADLAELTLICDALERHTGVNVGWSDCRVLPSSTTGHHHLYVQQEVPEVGYMHALMELAANELIEPNYALVSIRRRATFLRLPWVTKSGLLAAPVEAVADEPF